MRARVLAALGAALVTATLLTVPTPTAPAAAADQADAGAWSRTRTLERTFSEADGSTTEVDQRTVTVNVDKTRQLQGRERVHVTWSGAHPSAGRAANPYGEAGLNQEYPVVILQCRGLDDPSLPAAQQLAPETCWTSTRVQRSQRVTSGDAIWTRDLHATDAERQVKTGLDPFPAQACADQDQSLFTKLTPFRAAGGKVYPACSSETMPPEAAVGASFPPAEQAAFTKPDGTGATDVEVRSSIENESLGCSATTPCSLVVIPVMGLSCMARDADHATVDRNCRRGGSRLEGSSNFTNEGVDATVSPLYWWAPSNWRNRFAVPLDFGLAPNACDVLDQRNPVPFYGSELLSQAALQWAPAYCLRKDRFKWQQSTLPDDAAFQLVQERSAAAATVSGPRENDGGAPVGYAPTAVTGFAISYVADLPDNAGESTSLRLNARLLAKLLTESYPASGLGEQHPGLGKNPRSITVDPEFTALNPGLPQVPNESASTLMSLSTSSDVITELSSYIAADPDAAAFVSGQTDPWGMTVNPSYRGYALPTQKWELLDTFVPDSELECLKQNKGPYLPRVAAPVSSMRQIASAVLDGWPLVATKCDRSTSTDPWKLGRVDRQGMGGRFLLGLTTLADAERMGLRTAALQTSPGQYVTPTDASLAAAIATAKPSKGGLGPFRLSQERFRTTAAAYPGTMVVYTVAPLTGADKAQSKQVAQFIRTSTTEGQVRGRGNGQLPSGYLPITKTGPTGPLLAQATRVAALVQAQAEPREKKPRTATSQAGTTTAGTVDGAVAVPGSETPAVAATASDPVLATTVEPATTVAASAPLGRWLVPILIGLVVAGGSMQVVGRVHRRRGGA